MHPRSNPFHFMAVLYLLLDALAIAALALATVGIVPLLPGLSWVRVHLLTIGVLVQAVLGTLPGLAAARAATRPPGPRVTASLWLLVNASLAVLVMAMPAGQRSLAALAAVGVFAAVVLLIASLHRAGVCQGPGGRIAAAFFVAGPVFFLVGILMAISMLVGWSSPGGYMGVLEAHVHANVWGFLALVVAGVLLDRVPTWANHPLPFPGAVPATAGMIVVGATGLVAGPWFGLMPMTMLGLAVYVVGTGLLLANLAGAVVASRGWTPNLGHLLTAYIWMVVPALVAPIILLLTGALPSGAVEAAAVSGLVAGWISQIVLGAFVPQVANARGDQRYQGSWLGVLLVNVGVLALWTAAFLPETAPTAQVTASGFGLVVLGWLPGLSALLSRLGVFFPEQTPAV